MRLMAARLAEEGVVQFLDDRAFMGFSQREVAVLFIERSRAQALEVYEVADAARLDRLAAAGPQEK